MSKQTMHANRSAPQHTASEAADPSTRSRTRRCGNETSAPQSVDKARQSHHGNSDFATSGRAMTARDWASNFWITLVDEEGEVFYANPQTGDRQWALPAGSLVLPRSVDGEWYELWSEEHQLPYYYHTHTSETTWYKPDGFVIPLKAVQRFSAGRRFSLALDSASSILTPAAVNTIEAKPLPAPPPQTHANDTCPAVHFAESATQRQVADIAEPEVGSSHDPFFAALVRCIGGKTQSQTHSPTSPKRKTFSRSRATSAERSPKADSRARRADASAEPEAYNHVLQASEDGSSTGETTTMVDHLEHADVSALSQSSSTRTLSTPSSTPLNTPGMPQEGFQAFVDSSSDQMLAFSHSSMSPTPVEPRPLRFAKKIITGRLNAPLTLVKPSPSAPLLTDNPDSNRPSRTRQASDTGHTSKIGTPVTPRSPSAMFSSLFGKSPASPTTVTAIADEPESPYGGIVTEQAIMTDSPASEVKAHAGLTQFRRLFTSSHELSKNLQDRDGLGNAAVTNEPVEVSVSVSSPDEEYKGMSRRDSGLPHELLDDIHRITFVQYARTHFAAAQKHRASIFPRKSVTLESQMRWRGNDLEAPILALGKQLKWDAQQCFTHLQRVMGDKTFKDHDSSAMAAAADMRAGSAPWDTPTTEEARKLIAQGISNPDLRDEIYVQLLCQLTENASSTSRYRGYQFFQVLLMSWPPSPALEPTVRQFLLARQGGHSDARLAIIARHALVKLADIIDKGPRGAVPTLFEVQAASDSAFHPSVFGETVDRVMALQADAYPDAKVPVVLSFLADGVLALGGLRTPGIFRTPGDADRVKELRIILDQGRYTFAGYEDPHIAASLLKLWLRDLRQPLIPIEWYHQCMEAASSESRCVEIVQNLPVVNRRIVSFVISFLQIFTQEAVIQATLVPASSLAMIFTPSFFRGPPTSKTFNASPMGTSDSITRVFAEARIEQQFTLNLLQHLDVNRLEDEDDWIPTHGRHQSLSMSLSSSTSSSVYADSSDHSMAAETASEGTSRPSLDSTASTMSFASRPSFASSKRKNRQPRHRTRTAHPAGAAARPRASEEHQAPPRSRSVTDSGDARSIGVLRDLVHSTHLGALACNIDPAVPDFHFIKPVIVVNHAD